MHLPDLVGQTSVVLGVVVLVRELVVDLSLDFSIFDYFLSVESPREYFFHGGLVFSWLDFHAGHSGVSNGQARRLQFGDELGSLLGRVKVLVLMGLPVVDIS